MGYPISNYLAQLGFFVSEDVTFYTANIGGAQVVSSILATFSGVA